MARGAADVRLAERLRHQHVRQLRAAAPCRSFGAAITVTNASGEIVVLDSAGYGAVVINKSVSIISPPGIYAGVSVLAGEGVTMNTAGIEVTLKGLTINGQGGTVGIHFTQG